MGAMKHILLLGDSIFDNAAYTEGGPAVIDQLGEALRPDWRVTLLAQDGATISDVAFQVSRIPSDVDALVVSMGGNDALAAADLLYSRVSTVAEALLALAEPLDEFERDYIDTLMVIQEIDCPIALCTIYNGNFQPGNEQTAVSTAVRLFNDVIVRIARVSGCNVIELRDVCADPIDYANPIEPSSIGGAKIATALANLAHTVAARVAT